MLFHPLPAATLLLVMQASAATATATATAAGPSTKAPSKIDFMRSMNKRINKKHGHQRRLNQKDFRAVINGDSKRSAELRKKIIEKSTVVKKSANGSERKLQKEETAVAEPPAGANRKLEDAGNDDAAQENANNNAYNNYNNANYQANNNAQYKTYKYNQDKDGTDDYFNSYGEWENAFGFDPTMFSLSYHRCAAVKQFDDTIAASEDTTSVFATKRMAVFRFCPEQTCMGWQEEDSDYCGCEDQCADIFEDMEENGYEAGDNDEDYCEEACNNQCAIWEQQYGLYSGQDDAQEAEDAGRNRKLQNQNYYNNNANYYNNNQFTQMTFDPYYAEDQDDQENWGAQGEGCQANYGEYMIEMKDYLDMVLEWQEERFETYCEYCEECMWKVYQEWMENGYDGRDLKYEDFKASEKHRELSNYYNQCPEYDTCMEYQQTCKGGIQDEYSDYFECTQVETANGMEAYIGPHCAEDGLDITLGVYADQYCNEFIGYGVDIAQFLGEELEEGALSSYYNSAYGATLEQLKFVNEDNVCIPCRKGDLMWEEEGAGMDDDNNNYDNTEINELCENLYEVSARCDKHYRSYNTKTKQAKYAEYVAQEDLTCEFIDSIIMGNYNEMGEINLSDKYNGGNQQRGWMGDNMYAQSYREAAAQVSPLQVFGLIATILAVILLAAWSMTLHKSLSKTGPWRPRRGLQRPAASSAAAPDISRQSSGIVMGRSASNTSYYMS